MKSRNDIDNNKISKILKKYDYSIDEKAINTVIFVEENFYKERYCK
jgi:hypothetical protein